MRHILQAALAGLVMLAAPMAEAQKNKAPAEWDGLQKVDAKRFDVAYLAPGADFKPYTKVMIDKTEAAFRKNWLRKYNNSHSGLDQRITEEEALEMLELVQTTFHEILTTAYQEAGYQIVTTPAPDVLRIRTGVINLDVTSPDVQTSSRSDTFSSDAGEATLVLEVRDSMSGALLGRGVDRREIGDSGYMQRRVKGTNRADFTRVFRKWAAASIAALEMLKALPTAAVAQN